MRLIDILSRRSSAVVCVFGALLIVVLAAAAGLGLNHLARRPLSILARPPAGVEKIDLERAALLDEQKTLFVDARTADDYKDGHIPGAYNLDYYSFDQQFSAFTAKYDRTTPVVVYCNGISGSQNEDTCETSRLLADRLYENGYRHVLLFEGGWAFWQKKGLPIVAAAAASSERSTQPSMPVANYLRDLGMLLAGIVLAVFRKNRVALVACQVVLGAVFIVSGAGKIFDADKLAIIIGAYRILPPELVSVAALVMPWIELLSGVALVTGLIPASGAALISGMNLFFIPALSYRAATLAHQLGVSVFSVNFDCGCGLGENFAWVLVLRDTGYLVMGLVALTALARWLRPRPPATLNKANDSPAAGAVAS